MHALARLTLASGLAALTIVLFEVLRAALFGATTLGADVLGFGAAVGGLLGLPLWLLGCVALGTLAVIRGGWRWGRAEEAAIPPHRVVGWAIYGAFSLAAVVFGTQFATMKFVAAFKKAVYQGLAAGLVAALIVVVCAAFAGLWVGLLSRMARAASRRLPPFLDPTRPRAAAGFIVSLLIIGSILAPIVVKPLHTVDLRPARLLLFWGLALALAAWWVDRSRRGPIFAAVGAVCGLVFGGCLLWSAHGLAGSQRVRLSLDRDTLLAGPVAARFGRFGDADGDGVPRLFGGGDCDDTNPAIRPGVYDRPQDGIDQNCTGTDLVRAADPIRRPERAAPVAERDWNVLLLTIDALRHDVVARHMPRLQALADAGVDVQNAYSHGAATYWSVPALLASTLPSRLEMGRDQTPVGRMLLLPEVLRDAGWHTALFANVTVFFVRGLRQGAQLTNYDTSKYTVHGAKPGSEHMTTSLLAHIDRQQAGKLRPKRGKFFTWAHYYDPHDPYFEVEGFPAEDGSDKARYEAIARYLDAELGRLFDGLKKRGLWDNTVIIITADHGDEFLDHGHRFHGRTLYEEMVNVPLIMRVPGVEARDITVPMGQMELAPTLLELLGVRIPRQWMGRSRAAEVLTGQPSPIEPVFFEVFPDSNYDGWQVGMRLGDLKLIYRLDQRYFELYDLTADPLERDNVYDSHPEAEALTTELMVYLDHHLFQLAQGLTGGKKPIGSPDKPKKTKKKSRKPKRPKRAPKPPPRPTRTPPIVPPAPADATGPIGQPKPPIGPVRAPAPIAPGPTPGKDGPTRSAKP